MNNQEIVVNDIGAKTQNVNLNFATTPTYPYKEVTYENTLPSNYQGILPPSKRGGCCCTCGKGIKGNIIFLIVMCVLTIGLSLGAKLTSLSTLDEYKILKKIIIQNLDYNNQGLPSSEINDFRFEKFWAEYDDFESNIIIVDIIFPCILLIFLIIELIIYNTNLKKESKNSILRNVIIFINILFYICFFILSTLLIYTWIYSLIVLLFNPYYFEGAGNSNNFLQSAFSSNGKITGAIHIIILFILLIFNFLLTSTDDTIILLLGMYNEDDDKNLQNNMDKIKTKSLSIGNENINTQIKLNKCLYLKDLGTEGKTFTFKQILLENIKDDFIYINTENLGVQNMLSISNWQWPYKDPIVNILKPYAILIFISIIIIYVPTLFHIKDQAFYQTLKEIFKSGNSEKIKFTSIFNIVGDLESGITTSRFYVFAILLVILILFIIKRIYFGGFSRLLYINLSFYFSIILFIINLIYVILSICLAVFLILSIITIKDYLSNFSNAFTPKGITKLIYILIIQGALNASFFGEMGKPALSKSKDLLANLSGIKSELSKLKETNELGKTEFQYIGLDSNSHVLTEVIIPGNQRYLFYSLNNNANINDKDNNNVLDLNKNVNPQYSNTDRLMK